jgi:serine/threonine protein kinase
MTQSLPVKGDLIAQKYLVERALGMGGMGAVFEVTHRVTGKRFAVKWLLPNLTGTADAVQRFIREAQVAGRFEHPNVVEVYDIGQEGESFYMVMELLLGESLKDFIDSRGKLSAREAADIMMPALRGIAAAHDAGIVHRDLKPENIFLCRPTSSDNSVAPKVLDFGISKVNELAGEVSAGITKTGMVMGTPHYMSPEQIRAKPVDARTDVYACGVILYQLVSGELPFPGDTYGELVLQIVTQDPPDLATIAPQLPEGFAAVIKRAMARAPEDRFATAAELGLALQPHASVRFGSGANPTPLPQPALRTPAEARRVSEITETPLATMSVIERHTTGTPAGLKLGVGLGAVAVLGLLGALFALRGGQPPAAPDATATAAPAVAEPSPAPAAAPDEAPIEIDLRTEPERDPDAPPPLVATPTAPTAPAAAAAPTTPVTGVSPTPAVDPAPEPITAADRAAARDSSQARAERAKAKRKANEAKAAATDAPTGAGPHRPVNLDLGDF